MRYILMEYEVAPCTLILKRTVVPAFRLILFAKPAMRTSRKSGTVHSDSGLPASEFSVTIGFCANEKTEVAIKYRQVHKRFLWVRKNLPKAIMIGVLVG